MPFTISKTDEEADDIGPLLDKINRENGRVGRMVGERMVGKLGKGHAGGRNYTQAWDDPTMHPTDSIPLGGKLITYREELSDSKISAISEACRRGDVAAVRSLLGFSHLGSSKKYVGVDLGFKCQGQQSVKTFMQALPAELEALDVNLQGNQLMLPGIKVVSEGLPKNLQQLSVDLSHNRIQVSGVEMFMKALPRTVTCLTIGCSGMKMGLPGVKAIADNLPQNLVNFTVDLHDGRLGDDGCIYLAHALPKTLEHLKIHMRGDQGHLTNRGYWIFDRLIGDPDGPHCLPKLTNDCFRCVRDDTRACVQQYEIGEKSWDLVQRWLPHQNVC